MTQPRKRIVFSVSFVLPDEATAHEARSYIEDAVGSWKGSLMPYGADPENPEMGDPMSELDGDTVRVVQVRKKAEGGE